MDRINDGVEVEDTTISRPVTSRSRITGGQTTTSPSPGGLGLQGSDLKSVDWHAVVASVVSGLAITTMLVILGVSTGLITGNENTDNAGELGGILGAVGAWSVVAMVIGALAGSLLGGRLARWLDRGSVGYHALTSWGLSTLLTVVLVSLVTIAFSNATNAAANTATAADAAATEGQATGGEAAERQPAEGRTGENAKSGGEEAADDAADALGGAGLGIFLSMLLTLVASAAGWWIGSRKRLLDIEREPHETETGTAAAV